MEDIVKIAILMRKRAFAPYSNYRVGAAVKTKTGEINVINCQLFNVGNEITDIPNHKTISPK